MIKQAAVDSEELDELLSTGAVAVERSPVHYGLAGALLAAVAFGLAFPIALSAMNAAATGPEATVYAACGAIFGVITGGSIGAVVGGRGR